MMASGGGAKPTSRTEKTTTYYKGRKIRTETPTQVVIVDGDSGQMYSLNPAQKTYFFFGCHSQ